MSGRPRWSPRRSAAPARPPRRPRSDRPAADPDERPPPPPPPGRGRRQLPDRPLRRPRLHPLRRRPRHPRSAGRARLPPERRLGELRGPRLRPWAIERLGERGPIGICGLYRRATLDAPDLGYALLPAGRGRGFAREAGRAALEWAEDALGLRRILAITTDEHRASQRVLEALGMHLEGHVRIPGDDADLRLYATAPADSGARDRRARPSVEGPPCAPDRPSSPSPPSSAQPADRRRSA
ncbi:MAG: GNAT family N-acetyltransferase [Myxococcales bacterium]|nr:GNAT family N-acetyltransferase [Myxococcales bacterium]